MTIKELIDELRNYGAAYGFNNPVVMSIDPEGNSFCTLKHNDCLTPAMDENTIDKVIGVCIWPWAEGFDTETDACRDNDSK